MLIELVTHEGVFHADDVFATALLKLYYEANGDTTIVRRSSDVNRYINNFNADVIYNTSIDGNSAIVYDIGRGIFDHHQPDAKRRDDGGKYCSFGLLWICVGSNVIQNIYSKFDIEIIDSVWTRVDDHFVKPIDMHDNGEGLNPLSQLIGTFNPTWYENADDDLRMDKFLEAVEFAKTLLINEIKLQLATVMANSIINKEIEQAYAENRQYLVLDRFVPFNEAIHNNPHGNNIMFVIHPSAFTKGEWAVGTVRKELGTQEMRLPHAADLRGKPREELLKNNWTFVHANGFIGSALTKEDAIKLCEYSLAHSN